MTTLSTPAPRKGLEVEVYRPATPTAGAGITATVTRIVITGVRGASGAILPVADECQRTAPTDEMPEMIVVWRNVLGTTWGHVEPVDGPGYGRLGYMAGGNLVVGHGREWKLIAGDATALPVHDHSETTSEYRAASI
jgi:hypothetical protein